MFSEAGIYIPDKHERRVITPDEFYFGEPADLSETRKGLAEIAKEEVITFDILREVLSVERLQDLLNQRTDDDIASYSTLVERGIVELTDKAIDDLSDTELTALLRSDAIPHDILAQYANFQYHRKADQRAERLATMIAESSEVSDMLRANQLNLLGTLYHRHGKTTSSSDVNKKALQLLKDDTGPNVLWQRMKSQHGKIIASHSVEHGKEASLHAIDALRRILEARIVLGDVAHIGRTHLDIARIVRDTGDTDEALYHYRLAYEQMMDAQYHAKATDAQHELETLIEESRSHYTVVPEGPWHRESFEKQFEGMQQPASCLVRHGEAYIISYDHLSELFQPITVDQKRTNGAEKEVRSAIARMLNRLHPEIDPDAISGMKDGISLSKRKTKVVPADIKRQELDDGRKQYFYTVGIDLEHELFDLLRQLPLDKQKELGYVLLSVEELREIQATDPDLDILRESELAFLEKRNMRGE